MGLRGSYSFFACGRVCVTGLIVLLAAGASAQMSAPPDPLDFSGPDPTVRFKDISIEQHLDALVPLDLEFVDESGAAVRIGDYLGDRPAILALVYYECPMLCTLELNGIETVLSAMKFKVGEDFDVITVSIDPGETPEMAGRKKIAHLASLGEPGAESGWHFLTGEAENIELLADTVGFGYVYDAAMDQYAHAAGIMILTPTGRIARYYYGIEYIPRDVEFGLVESSKGKIGSLVDQFVLLCFAYDPSTGQYGFYVIGAMRIMAVLTILALLAFWVVHYLQVRKADRDAVSLPSKGPSSTNQGTV